jgi:hypothetical protein
MRAAAVSTALAVAAIAGCGGGDDETARPSEVPSGSVAVVGDAQITKRELDRRVATLTRAAGRRSSGTDRRQLQSQALSVLLRENAIEQEAAERGVTVDPREVRRRWNSARRAQFANRKAVRRFLGGQTEQDLLRQLRLQLLTERIHDQIREDDGDAAVERFQRDLQQRWTDRTACNQRYSALGCNDRSG